MKLLKLQEWNWYYEVVGKKQCPIVDTWWQTETGGILISPFPAFTKLKPGSATKPFFGISPVILNENGEEQLGNPAEGCLHLKIHGQAKCELFMATMIDLLMFIFQNLRVLFYWRWS